MLTHSLLFGVAESPLPGDSYLSSEIPLNPFFVDVTKGKVFYYNSTYGLSTSRGEGSRIL